jgi:uncharacterized membrane protein
MGFFLYLSMTSLAPKKRINSIDILRGIVMVVMALDHVRDFFSAVKYEPTDLAHASTVLFFTRWVTHFCAPVFIFLSGTSAFLSMKLPPSAEGDNGGQRRSALKTQSWRLLTRGLWLVVLEVTIVRLGWAFDVDYSLVILQVIWAIGISMVVLSGLIWLPRPLMLLIGLAMIFGHDMMDGFDPGAGTQLLWHLLHQQGMLHYGQGNTLFVIYPLIPWIGVMAVGYCFGALYKMKAGERKKWLYGIGIGAMALFVILRLANGYGDPSAWHTQAAWWRTVLSFINVSKYPPSLLYLLMTLGPAITALAVMESGEKESGVRRAMSGVGNIFIVYGRVPMFYYVLHIYLIHAMAIASGYLFRPGEPIGIFSHPGYSLTVVYGVWLLAVAMLYFPCRWFMHIKKSHQKWWLSYL